MKYRFCYQCGSLLEQRSIEGRWRSYCPVCKVILYENPLPSVAAVAINESNEILLVKRKFEPGVGGWCLPGGFIEIGETPEEAVVRELYEESGVVGKNPQLLGVGIHLNGFYGDVLIIGYLIQVEKTKLHEGDDAAEACFFPAGQRPRLIFPVHEKFIEQWQQKVRER